MREPTQSLDIKAIHAWRIEAVIEAFIVLALLLLAQVILSNFSTPSFIPLLLWLTTGAYFIFSLYHVSIMPKQKYKKWKYEVHPTAIFISEGVIFHRKTQIPINRIQQVTIKQGPVARRFHLATVEITNAASSIEIHYLEHNLAEKVSAEIKHLVLVSDNHE